MDYTGLGRTGLKVSRLCLGTMNFGPQADEAASHEIMDQALDLGFHFSIPRMYTAGRSAKALLSKS
jgi:aryl-alcohol dehydrogenase-like predicted oxidoreductase